MTIEVARVIKEAFLKQNAFDEVDAFSSPQKQVRVMKLIYLYNKYSSDLIAKGVSAKKIMDTVTAITDVIRSRYSIKNNELQKFDELENKLRAQFDQLAKEVS